MHTLASFQSKDLSASSKTIRNVIQCSPLCTVGKRNGGKCNAPVEDSNNMPPPLPIRKLQNPPQDINHEFDISDTDDCESVGSNSLALVGGNETCSKQRNIQIDKANPKFPIHDNGISRRENPSNSHLGTKTVARVITRSTGGELNLGPKSTVSISNSNSSSDVISLETKLGTSNKTHDVRLKKHHQVVGVGDCSHQQTQCTMTKISRPNNTNYSSTRNAKRDSPIVQSIDDAKRGNNQIIENRDTSYVNFDEGDGGGPPYTTNLPSAYKHKNNNAQITQYQDEEYHQPFDGEYGNRFNLSNYLPPRKGRLQRHGRCSRERSEGSLKGSRGGSGGRDERNSRERSRGSKRGSREESGGNIRGSRGGSQGRYGRQSRSNSGGSNSESTRGSQESSRQSSKGQKGHRRKRSGGSDQNNSQSSQSYSESLIHQRGLTALIGHKPYPANWRCFGRRPPAIHEFRPLGEVRVKNVRPAGKLGYLMRNADENRGCQGPDSSDAWDGCYGLAKPINCQWSTPLPYGTQVIRAGDIDPYFRPTRGDLIIINPAQKFYRAMKSGYVMTYRGRDYSFGVGDLIVRLGRFMPNGEYIPYGNLELYMHTQTRDMRLLGRQPFLLVDFNYHNLDYESPGKYLAIGTFLNESFFPRRGDIIIRGGAWAENYPNIQRKHHSSVKYWRPRMEFLPNDILLRPYVDIGRKYDQTRRQFYWGAAELYTYSGKGLAWAYWGRDDHICDTPYPHEQEHGIKTGHHKDEVGHYGDGHLRTYGARYTHGHQANDDCHSEHERSRHHSHHSPHGHQANDDCHSEHEFSPHKRR